jgi:hypothetical protein
VALKVVTVPTYAGGSVVVGAVVAGALVALDPVAAGGLEVRVTDREARRVSRIDPSHAVVAQVATMTAVMIKARRHTFGVR